VVFPHPYGFPIVYSNCLNPNEGVSVNFCFRKVVYVFVSISLTLNASFALPIDWSGVFGVDSHLLNNTCRTEDNNPTTGSGSMGINGDCATNFQSYVMRLNPNIVINDGASLKAEFSSGFSRGNFAGTEAGNTLDPQGTTFSNSYYFTTPAQNSGLNVNQIYMELFADAALVKLGRFSRNYGLGAIFNDGSKNWDRFFTVYDGAEAEMKISNFSLTPYWAKISSLNNNSSANASGGSDVKESGVTAKYHNRVQDLVVSVLYAKRFSESDSVLYDSKSEVTIIDPYISKKWNKFTISAEVPMLSGVIGTYGSNSIDDAKITANSYLLESKYELNPKWEIGFNAGQISGDKGSSDKFEATSLHPNYQIADLMFRYRYNAFDNGNENIFNSSITNTRYFNLFVKYKTDKWTWKGSLITAAAMEAASSGSRAFHHEDSYLFDASEDQDDSLGTEFDISFDYQWNPNVIISGYYGYWLVGDYYAFTNTADSLTTADVHGGGVRVSLDF
jgi:hypothetical protein